MLKRLLEEAPACAGRAKPATAGATPPQAMPAEPGTRDASRRSHLPRRATRLNGDGLGEGHAPRRVRHRRQRPRYAPGDSFGLFPSNDPALADADPRRDARAGRLPRRRQDVPRCADRGLCAGPRARHAVRADQLPGRRRAAQEGQGCWPRARTPTATRPPSTCWRRWRSSGRSIPIPKRSWNAWSRCSRGSIPSPRRPLATPGELHLTVDARALRHRRARSGSASPRPSSPTASQPGARRQGLHPEGARLRAAEGRRNADHHGRPRHRHRAVPLVPVASQGDQGAGPRLAVLRPPARGHRLLLSRRARRQMLAGRR